MEDSFAKVMSLAAFIVLGHLLRRFNILKDQAFAAISALVMNVTLPSVILTNLNGDVYKRQCSTWATASWRAAAPLR